MILFPAMEVALMVMIFKRICSVDYSALSLEDIDLRNQSDLLTIDSEVLPGRRCVSLPFAIWPLCHLLIFF